MEPAAPSAPPSSASRSGCAGIGWLVFALAAAFVAFFGYKVWHYARAIRSGGAVNLPQFEGRFTIAAGGAAGVVAPPAVDRSVVETINNPELGNPNAALTIVEFADMECPYSKEAALTVRRLMAAYGDRVRFIFRDFPVDALHPGAFQVAVAAECAREQDKFWPFHDKVYGATGPFSLDTLMRFGREIGLESAQFERCVAENRYESTVQADLDAAKALGLRGTPTFFFNGRKVEGAIPEDVFVQLIERLPQEAD